MASTVFRDMFTFDGNAATYQDLPFVEITEKAQIVEKFLLFAYPRSLRAPPKLDDLKEVAEILQMTVKYDSPGLKEMITDAVDWPAKAKRHHRDCYTLATLFNLATAVKEAAAPYIIGGTDAELKDWINQTPNLSVREVHLIHELRAIIQLRFLRDAMRHQHIKTNLCHPDCYGDCQDCREMHDNDFEDFKRSIVASMDRVYMKPKDVDAEIAIYDRRRGRTPRLYCYDAWQHEAGEIFGYLLRDPASRRLDEFRNEIVYGDVYDDPDDHYDWMKEMVKMVIYTIKKESSQLFYFLNLSISPVVEHGRGNMS